MGPALQYIKVRPTLIALYISIIYCESGEQCKYEANNFIVEYVHEVQPNITQKKGGSDLIHSRDSAPISKFVQY